LAGSINNSVLLTSMNLARSHESSIEPRVAISNNDSTVKFYDVPVRCETFPLAIKDAGMLRLDVAVNHSSLSPDGQTLLSVGDSPKVYLHRLSGGSRLTFTPITTLTLPPPDNSSLYHISSNLAASFSTAFSSNGTKFAVASQEGAVAVWDVRSSKPLKVFQTDKNRMPEGKSMMNGNASGWLSDDPWDWTRGGYQAPGWGVRSVKFGSGDSGKEIMTFTEHTSLLHVIDARTFETEEIVCMPSCARQGHQAPQLSPIPSPRARSGSRSVSPIRTSSSRSSIFPPPPPRIVLALEDTFRIPPSSSTNDPRTSHARWRASRLRNRADADEAGEGIVVIPPLGDVVVDNEVRQLFGRHGRRTRHAPMESSFQSRSGVVFDTDVMYDVAAEDERELERDRDREREHERENADGDLMEVDELESDCISSHTPSRSSSPSPSTHIPLQISPSPLRAAARPHQGRTRRKAPRKEDLDLAGTCFDPSGAYIYVASVDGVAEWCVRGAEKRWWFGSEYA